MWETGWGYHHIFLLLQSLLASARCYLRLSACYAYQLVLGRFLLPPLWRSSPQYYFYVIGETCIIYFFYFLIEGFLFWLFLSFCGSVHIYDRMIYPFSNTTSYPTFYDFFSSFRITLWPMWLANSKRQPCSYPPQSHAQEDTKNWQKKTENLMGNLCCAREHSVQFFVHFLHS